MELSSRKTNYDIRQCQCFTIYIIQSLHSGTLPLMMLSCSGRNYNFRCIYIFFGVFLRETVHTAAKSRTNLSTNPRKVTKRVDRLAPNLVHMCRFIWEWIHAKQIAPRDTRGNFGGGGGLGGSTIQKYWEAVKRLDRLAPTLVQVYGFIWEWTKAKYKSPLNTPGGISVGV